MPKNLEHQLEVKRVETLYDQTISSMAANSLTAVVFFVVLSLNGHGATWPWLLGIFAVISFRLGLLRRFRAQDRATLVPSLWFKRYGIGISITGSLWGFIGAYSMLTDSVALPFFAVAVLVGMVGGSVATCAVSVPVFLAFTLPTLLPTLVVLLTGGSFERIGIGVLILVYIGVVTRSVIQIREVIVRSIFHRYENKRLLGELGHEKEQIEASEKRLRSAYDELEATHTALVEQRNLTAEKASQVKILQGLLPICAGCKKIRDDGGDWNVLEVYIDAHSEAEFSHGLCPECIEIYQASPADLV